MAETQYLIVECAGERYAVRGGEVLAVRPAREGPPPERVIDLAEVMGAPSAAAARAYHLLLKDSHEPVAFAIDAAQDVVCLCEEDLLPIPELTGRQAARLGIHWAFIVDGTVVLIADLREASARTLAASADGDSEY